MLINLRLGFLSTCKYVDTTFYILDSFVKDCDRADQGYTIFVSNIKFKIIY